MGDGTISDARIAEMSAGERRDLIHRLERPLDELVPPAVAERSRRIRLTLMISGSIGLLVRIIYLALTLPTKYVAQHWRMTWVGFDALLVVLMTATVVLGLLRRQLLLLTAFATGVLLICDAWFDVMTVGPDQRWVSILSAALVELPLAVILIVGTLRIVRLTAIA